MQRNILTKGSGLLAASSAVLAICFSQASIAHTTIVPSSLDEGTRLFADVSIAHGCNGTAVRAMSTVFPTADSQLLDSAGVPADMSNLVFPRHGGARLAQDIDVFEDQAIVNSSTGSTRGFHYTEGYLQTDLTGQIPFRFTPPSFNPDSCAKTLEILVPIANWCSKSTTAVDRADIWMGRLTAKFNDPAVQPVGFWPKITIHRDMENNPLPDSCNGVGTDLELSPTDAEIDELLPIEDYWPANLDDD